MGVGGGVGVEDEEGGLGGLAEAALPVGEAARGEGEALEDTLDDGLGVALGEVGGGGAAVGQGAQEDQRRPWSLRSCWVGCPEVFEVARLGQGEGHREVFGGAGGVEDFGGCAGGCARRAGKGRQVLGPGSAVGEDEVGAARSRPVARASLRVRGGLDGLAGEGGAARLGGAVEHVARQGEV